jgi:histidine triad (HIT) family protein
MSDCLFCKIVDGSIPSDKVFENETVIAFKDIHPQAKDHLIFINKKHTKNIIEANDDSPELIAQIFQAISDYTHLINGLADEGFRVVTNVGPNGGQTIFHTHFHVLGGEKLAKFGGPKY